MLLLQLPQKPPIGLLLVAQYIDFFLDLNISYGYLRLVTRSKQPAAAASQCSQAMCCVAGTLGCEQCRHCVADLTFPTS